MNLYGAKYCKDLQDVDVINFNLWCTLEALQDVKILQDIFRSNPLHSLGDKTLVEKIWMDWAVESIWFWDWDTPNFPDFQEIEIRFVTLKVVLLCTLVLRQLGLNRVGSAGLILHLFRFSSSGTNMFVRLNSAQSVISNQCFTTLLKLLWTDSEPTWTSYLINVGYIRTATCFRHTPCVGKVVIACIISEGAIR